MSIDISKANLASVLTESILFGFFSILFWLSLYLLLRKKTVSRPLNTRFACALSFMYMLAITHEGISFKRTLDGFAADSNEPSQDFFNKNNGGIDVCKLTVYALQSLLGDLLMIYRLGIICSGYRRVLVPSIALMTGSLVSGIVMLVAFSKQKLASPFSSTTSLSWMIAFFSFSLIINLGGTIAITVRIWSTRTTMSSGPIVGLSPVTVVLLDPVTIYSVSLLCLLSLFSAQNDAVILMLDWIPQIIGIVASLVIVRIGFKSLWNGRLDITPRRDSSESPPKVPPKDDVWIKVLKNGGGGESSSAIEYT